MYVHIIHTHTIGKVQLHDLIILHTCKNMYTYYVILHRHTYTYMRNVFNLHRGFSRRVFLLIEIPIHGKLHLSVQSIARILRKQTQKNIDNYISIYIC